MKKEDGSTLDDRPLSRAAIWAFLAYALVGVAVIRGCLYVPAPPAKGAAVGTSR